MKKAVKIGILVISVFLIASTALLVFAFCVPATVELDMSKLDFTNAKGAEILDISDEPVPKPKTSKYISLDELPPHVKQAFVSMEDKRFYKHSGVDYTRIIGAAKHNLTEGNLSQGGSTITQQLIKNTHLSNEKKLQRKINEAKLARLLEKKLTKDEILLCYLNAIYFGNGAYGIKQAAALYFNCEVSQLTVAQAATLTAIVKAPSTLTAISNADELKKRKDLTLNLMHKEEYIDQRQLETSLNEDTTLGKHTTDTARQIYYHAAITQARQILGVPEKEISENYTISTYYKESSQKAAEAAISDDATLTANGTKAQKCAIVANNSTHGVEGLYAICGTNIMNMRRQMASTIKPLAVFAPSLDKGLIAPLTSILDEEKNWGDYHPKNSNYKGWVSARYALQQSLNIPAIKILEQLGVSSAIEYMQRNGFDITENEKLSLALGSTEQGATLLQLLQGYMTLANNGMFGRVSLIRSISDKNGNVVYSHNLMPKRIFQEDTAFLMTDMLCDVVSNGTAKAAKIDGIAIAGKTGTGGAYGKNNNDAFFVSYTTENTALTWLGGDGENMLPQKIGGGTAAKMASTLYKHLYKKNRPLNFKIVEGVEKVKIKKSIYESDREIYISNEETDVITDYFLTRSMPQKMYRPQPNHSLSVSVSRKMVTIWIDNPEKCTYRIYRIVDGQEQQIGLLQNDGTFKDIHAPGGEVGYYAAPIDSNIPSTGIVIVTVPERKLFDHWFQWFR